MDIQSEIQNSNYKILVVEDSEIQAEMLRKALVNKGYSVIIAKNGQEGFEMAKKEKPSLIISDILMPVMDGYKMCKEIKSSEELKNIPVILLTQLTESEDIITGLESNAEYYITKPYNEDYLLLKVEMILKNIVTVKNRPDLKAVELSYGGKSHFVRSGREQTINFLFSTYENTVIQNRELINAQREIKKLNEDLNQKAEALEAANKELKAFAYSVSHDLHAPLRPIEGFSKIILNDYADKLDERGRQLLNRIKDSARKMGQLIDDLLSFSRTGQKDMVFSEINMNELMESVVEEIKANNDDRRLQFDVKPLPSVYGDLPMLRQVFVNLISNAVKFTASKDTAVIEIGCRTEDNENVCYIKDNGVGFDMKYADKLFGVFHRLHGEDEFKGTGIGLAIVKRIIHRHGCRIWAEGKVNEGAAFYFTLPVVKE